MFINQLISRKDLFIFSLYSFFQEFSNTELFLILLPWISIDITRDLIHLLNLYPQRLHYRLWTLYSKRKPTWDRSWMLCIFRFAQSLELFTFSLILCEVKRILCQLYRISPSSWRRHLLKAKYLLGQNLFFSQYLPLGIDPSRIIIKLIFLPQTLLIKLRYYITIITIQPT